jgi:RNA polymerase sigma-70 factor (sigma-E family)
VRAEQEAEFADFVRSSHARHQRLATLLCGDPDAAQDVVQRILVRLYRHWPRVSASGDPDAYVARAIRNEVVSWRRSAWRRWERSVGEPPDTSEEALLADVVVDRADLARLLPALPARERVALVTRYYEDRSVAEVARELGCSEATAKRLISSGLAALRRLVEGGTP